MNPYFAPSQAELLEHSSFLEELSCSLVSDRQTADDIVQDTWLAVLERPPAHSINPIGWLGTVARNLARRDRRTQTRRSYREQQVARPEGLPSGEEAFERTRSLSQVAAAVEELHEPYRTVVYLRFFENLKPSEIAERQGIGLATIKSQLHRGLGRLRDNLEDDFGQDGTDWRGVLCGCFGWRMSDGVPVPISLSSTSVASKIGLVVVLLLALTTGFILLNKDQSDSDVSIANAVLAQAEDDTEVATRGALREPIATVPEAALAEAATRQLSVKVVNRAGESVEHATIWIATEQDFRERGSTDALGLGGIEINATDFVPPRTPSKMITVLPSIEPRVGVMATGPDYSPSRVSWLEADKLNGAVVVITVPPHGFSLSGHVLDESGLPIDGVSVERHDVREGLWRNKSTDIVVYAAPTTTTNAFGRFAFDSLPNGLSWIRFKAPGFATHWKRMVVQGQKDMELDITLQVGGVLSGRVEGTNGRAIPGARVWTKAPGGPREFTTFSDEQGDFSITDLPPGERVFYARGGLNERIGIQAKVAIASGAKSTWYPVLGQLPEYRIQITDESGVPVSDATVQVRATNPPHKRRYTRTTDADGVLSIHEQFDSIKRVDLYLKIRYGIVTTFPDAHLEDLVPGDALYTVVVNRAQSKLGKIAFNVVNNEGEPFKTLVVLACNPVDNITRRVFSGSNQADILAHGVIPGEVELLVSCMGHGHLELGSVSLNSGERLELPDIRAPRLGTVRIDWRYAAGGGEPVALVQRFRSSRAKTTAVRIERKEDRGPLETYELLPGDYTLNVSRKRDPVQSVEFTIESGFETLIEVHPLGETGE